MNNFEALRAFTFTPDDKTLARWNPSIVAADSGNTSISIFDAIGNDPWSGEGVTAKRIAAALRSIGEQDVTVDINSPGGDFFEGLAIYNLLKEHPHRVSVRVIGLAASAASVIAMAGDEILMAESSFLMIHNAWGMVVGNRHDLREAAEKLEPFDDSMAALYAKRAGIDKATAAAWMDEEKWFNGQEAVAAGLSDGLLESDAVTESDTDQKAIAAVRRIDAALARQGIPRSERRSLLREVKGGTHDAASNATPCAGNNDELKAALRSLLSVLENK